MYNWSSWSRKKTAARAFTEILRNNKGNKGKEPFYIHIFHQGTKLTDYYEVYNSK